MIIYNASSTESASHYKLSSPDGSVYLGIACSNAGLSYSLCWDDRKLLENSLLSLLPGADYKVLSQESSSIENIWKPVWGQFESVHDRCEELILKLDASGTRVDLICRVYNDGIGFRFVVPVQENIEGKAVNFVCEYNGPSSLTAWFPAGEHEPVGPVRFDEAGPQQRMPATVKTDEGIFLGLLESDLYTATEFQAAELLGSQSESKANLTNKGATTPWRVILLGTQPGALVTSTVPSNLAAECTIKDVSWIKPGKCVWDWRVHGYRAGDFTYGINTPSYKRFIDFAADNDIRYFLIDDAWFDEVKDGKMLINPEVDLNYIMAYAKKKGVDIILYYDRKKGDSLSDEDLFRLYGEFGAAGTKYGFMGNNASFTRSAVEQSAANRLLVDFHDHPCPMTGISRTLPNAVTREFCHCQQDRRTAFTPRSFLKMALVNALAGPLDQCNGAYGLTGINKGERDKGPIKNESYNSTVVSETARVLVIFSGLIVLPDAPEEYQKKADLFAFIRTMPASWDESRVINSEIGKHITTARRSGDQWFIGSVINEDGGVLRIPLTFLETGKVYAVTFYEDAADTHYIKNRESYKIRNGHVCHTDVIEATMAPGGGHCMWIRTATFGNI